MKTLDELNQLLSHQAPSDPLVKLLNDTFGPLGWELADESQGMATIKVMAKVSEGHFLSVARSAPTFEGAARRFGLEVRNAQSNEGQRQVDAAEAPSHETRPDSAEVGAQGASVGQGDGEPKPAVPAGTPKPSRKTINHSISECSKIILAKKLRTQDELIKMVQAFAVKRKEELNEGQAMKLLEQLKEILQ